MTRHASLLVRGPLPPLPEPRIVFAPGDGATFDGDRWHLSVTVTVERDGSRDRRSFDRANVSDALESVRDLASGQPPAAVVFDGRDWLREPLPDATVEWIETELGRIARAESALLVVRTWDAPTAEDHDRYAAVIDPADEHTWRGEPADPRPRQCSHSPDTARGHPTPDP